jgi:hypothetical protein
MPVRVIASDAFASCSSRNAPGVVELGTKYHDACSGFVTLEISTIPKRPATESPVTVVST